MEHFHPTLCCSVRDIKQNVLETGQWIQLKHEKTPETDSDTDLSFFVDQSSVLKTTMYGIFTYIYH